MPPGPARPHIQGGRQLALAATPPNPLVPNAPASRGPGREAAHTPHRIRSSDRLDALLNDLGPLVRRGGDHTLEVSAPLPCGLPAVDTLLDGGFPSGRISEIVGPTSSGRTSLCLALLATTTRRAGELVAVVDHVDAFDPLSAEAAGVDLERVLWARVDEPREALRCTERLLETEGIPLTLLDLRTRPDIRPGIRPDIRPGTGLSTVPARPPIGKAAWLRLARLAAGTRSALVVLTTERSVGPQAELVLEMQPARPRFRGTPPQLETVELRASVARQRTGFDARSVTFCLDAGAVGIDLDALGSDADPGPA